MSDGSKITLSLTKFCCVFKSFVKEYVRRLLVFVKLIIEAATHSSSAMEVWHTGSLWQKPLLWVERNDGRWCRLLS